MMRLRSIRHEEKGAGAVEFALIAPVLFGMLIGINQLGHLYFARADLRNAIAAGAREAQIFPRPSTATVSATITSKMRRLKTNRLTGPTITLGTTATGHDFAEIVVTYAVPVDFVIYRPPPVTLVERRRVFLQPAA